MKTPRELQELYKKGTNISALLRAELGVDHNTVEIIELAYDLQTGSYIAGMQDASTAEHQAAYTAEIARVISSLCSPDSILEAGVGEGTTLSGVAKSLGGGVRSYGFDLSWSRAAFAKRWIASQGVEDTVLCSGDLLDIPFQDNSIDVVYTSHSIEPNGGREEPILCELFRVARRYLVLLEPGYELATDDGRRRMESHGYCRNLPSVARKLGYQVLSHGLFPVTSNPLNPTALTIIRKESSAAPPRMPLACPRYKTPLLDAGGALFSKEALVVYPVIGGVPCLRISNGVLASKFPEVVTR